MTKRFSLSILPVLALAAAAPAHAALPVGAKAPSFATEGALGGKGFHFDLDHALAKGPVVLYFFPKSFTPGCTVEAHMFADAAADFRKAGATLIGMSADGIEPLKRFSTLECRNKFPVASASPAVIKEYDVAWTQANRPTGLTNRTSYVIGRDHRIVLSYSNLDPREHVTRTLAAVRALTGR